jgi:hypothetical protein
MNLKPIIPAALTALALAACGTTAVTTAPLPAGTAASGVKSSSHAVLDPWNSRLSVDVGQDGRFSVGAFPDPATGNPATGSFKLLYGWPGTGTSYTTVQVDGVNAILGKDAPVTSGPADSSTSDTTTFADGAVSVTQTLSLAANPQTGQEDAARVAYTITNNDTVSHDIGVRAMFDTDVNDNDGAPFRVPGIGAVTTEQDLSGASVPDSFQVFQDLADASHIASATLRGADATPPDRLVIAAWPSIYPSSWDYTITPGAPITSDSAYAAYWNPAALAPGASRTFVTYYGLADVTVDLTPPLALGLTGPASLTAAGTGYSPHPFSVVATVSDDGTAPVDGASVTLHLPAGLHTADPATVSLGTVSPGDPEQLVTWHVTADPQSAATTFTYSVTATGSNTTSKTLSRQVAVPALAGTSSFHVQVDNSSVGGLFGTLGKRVLDSAVNGNPSESSAAPPTARCATGWQVSATDNTDFVLHVPTNGNVTGSRIDVGGSSSHYLVPGQTGLYCVSFTHLDQIFDVLYDMGDPSARAADAAMLVAGALGLPAGDAVDLSNFVASVANIPDLQRTGECIGSRNLLCAARAINALMTDRMQRNALLSALHDYALALGKSIDLTYLDHHLRQKLLAVITTGLWVVKFIGQVVLSPVGFVAFDTVP